MSDMTLGRENAVARSASNLYRAVWRWHFYAGLMVLPFMITLAVTGALYLFKDEIDTSVYSDLKRVTVAQTKVTPEVMVDAALANYPGTAVKYLDPAMPGSSAEITVASADFGKLAVYVNPYDGSVLGALPDRGTIMWTIRYLHSLKYFGDGARMVIELAGGWSILLVGTGIYLWWPRGKKGGVVSVRGKPRNRMFWRDLHAVTGLFAGVFIVFLAITGMPWSGVWGEKVNEWANGSNFGYPSGVRVDVPMSGEHLDHVAKTSWSLEQARLPESSAAAGTPIGLNKAVETFDRLGLHRGYTVAIPGKPAGVYTGSVYPDAASQQRVIHLDQYSGEPLIDMGFADYGLGGKWMEWGISVHMGQEFGLVTQLVLLAACLGIVLLAVSAGVMWWKRRPSGSLGVPPLPDDPKVFRGLIAILALGGIAFPLVGISLLVMLVLDWAGTRVMRPRFA
nr:PepSY domain-containing protein [Aminobacter aminovorans]